MLRSLLIVVAVAALGIEAWSVYPFYFQDYVRHLADLNYSISLQMARAIDAFADDGQSYIKIFALLVRRQCRARAVAAR